MSRAAYMREYRSRQKALASRLPPVRHVSVGEVADDVYLARIAELEEEVRNLKAELAQLAVPTLDVGDGLRQPPSLVTADGTQGMRRGVSASRSRPVRGDGSER